MHKDIPFVEGDGEMATLIRRYDWENSVLGNPDGWSLSLRTLFRMMLASRFPMLIFWGPDLITFYNDAFRPSLGNDGKHPSSLGQKGEQSWAESWPVIGPMIHSIMAGGDAVWFEDQKLPIYREGQMGYAYWTYSFSPLSDDTGAVNGILVTCTETTKAVESVEKLQDVNITLQQLVAQNLVLRREEQIAHQQVLTSQQQLLALFEESPVAIATLSKDGLTFRMANSFYCQLVGRTAGDILDKPLLKALPELAGQGFDLLLEEVLRTGVPYTASEAAVNLIRQNRMETIYVDLTYQPRLDPDGSISGIFVVAVDVTRQVRSRRVVESGETRKTFLLALSDRLRVLNDPDRIQYEAACLLGEYLQADRVGYAEDQGNGRDIVVTKNYVNNVSSLEGSYVYADYGETLLADFLAGHTVVRPDIPADPSLTPDEKEAHRLLELGATINKPLLREGNLAAVMFIHFTKPHRWSAEELALLEETAERTWSAVERARVDMAIRQREEQYRLLVRELDKRVQQRTDELLQLNQDLKRSNENLQQFAYIASHDLQEPLRKIQSFGDVLKEQYQTSLGDGIMYLDRMQQSAGRMSTLIKDLLNYSRISTGQELRELVSLPVILDTVLSDLELVIRDTGAVVRIDPLPAIRGDASQLRQLFQNLLTNALKFRVTDVAPVIYVRTEVISADVIREPIFPTRPATFYYRIEVIDNGIGFDDRHVNRIFQLFQRLHGRNEYSGTGIGLAICEKVVANHGGAITASSQPGHGAVFRIYLPKV
nr:ATP-binding protein [uncultured Arsenicibacter sp.]